MRLLDYEIKAIHEVISAFDKEAKIYLFGSRVDDEKKGGDIDLLLISEKLNNRDKRKIRLALCDKLGEQKIDILIGTEGEKNNFYKIALNEGVLL